MRLFELFEVQNYHVIKNSVYGKVLGNNGNVVRTDYDNALELAERYNGTLVKTLSSRYIIKVSESTLRDIKND